MGFFLFVCERPEAGFFNFFLLGGIFMFIYNETGNSSAQRKKKNRIKPENNFLKCTNMPDQLLGLIYFSKQMLTTGLCVSSFFFFLKAWSKTKFR